MQDFDSMLIDYSKKENRIDELTKENKFLLEQLHEVQRELEKYYYKFKEFEEHKSTSTKCNILGITSEIQDALVENLKFQSLAEQQKIALQIERKNSLPSRLGKMLINGVKSGNSLIALPIRLLKVWKSLDQNIPPSVLGGKNFEKVVEIYTTNGTEAMENLLDSVNLSHVMRANAYTAIARKMMLVDPQQTAILARKAWETDPRPYRLKWLAFRLHESGNAISAESLLEMLPSDINMTSSEKLHAERIRKESKRERIQIVQNTINKSIILNSTIIDLKKYIEKLKNKENEAANKLKEIREEHKQELKKLNIQLIEQKSETEKALKKAEDACKIQVSLQKNTELQKKESDDFTLQTAFIIKNLLTEFETNKDVILNLIRILFKSSEKIKM